MKHMPLAVAFAFAITGSAAASFDGFGYTEGPLGNQNGGSGFTGGWFENISSGTGSSTAQVTAGSLVLPNNAFSSTGGKLGFDDGTDDAARGLTSDVVLKVGTNNGPIYFSFLLERTSETGEFNWGYRRNDGSGWLSVGVDDDDFTVGRISTFLTGGTIKVDGVAGSGVKAGFQSNTTYLFAGVLERNSNGVSIFANVYTDGLQIEADRPTDWMFEAYRNSGNSSDWGRFVLDPISGEFNVDDVRFDADSWSNVASGIPSPGTFGLLGAAAAIGASRRRRKLA